MKFDTQKRLESFENWLNKTYLKEVGNDTDSNLYNRAFISGVSGLVGVYWNQGARNRATKVLNRIEKDREVEMEFLSNNKLDQMSDDDNQIFDGLMKSELRDKFEDILKDALTPRQYYIVTGLFGIGGEAKTYEQLGEMFGITKSKVKNVLIIAMRRLKNNKEIKLFHEYI